MAILDCDLDFKSVNDLCKSGAVGILFLNAYHSLLESIRNCNTLRKQLNEPMLSDAGIELEDIHAAYTILALAQALVRPLKKGQERSDSLRIISVSVRFSRLPLGGMRILIIAHWPEAFDVPVIERMPPVTNG